MRHAFTKEHVQAAKSIVAKGGVALDASLSDMAAVCEKTGLLLRGRTRGRPSKGGPRLGYYPASLARNPSNPVTAAWASSDFYSTPQDAIAHAITALSQFEV